METEGRPADRRLPLVIVTCAFFATLLAANLATPLYMSYRSRFGFSTAIVALIFAVYALVLIPSLLAFGQVSDRFGRRRVIVAGLAVAVAGLALFAAAPGVEWLFAARATQGLGQGMMSGAATAALAELVPRGGLRRAALLATLAQTGGVALGPVVAGLLATVGVAPYVLPYLGGIAVCVVVCSALRFVPETAPGGSGGWRVQRPGVPGEIRAAFARVALTAAAVWSVAAGLFLSVIPAYAVPILHTRNLAVLGAVAGTMLASSCVTQIAVRRGAPPAPAQAGGLVLLAAGLVALVLATPLHSVTLLVAGAVIAGVGHGLAFLAAQDSLTRIVPPDRRAEVSAAFYVCVYLGVALPVIGIGVIAAASSLFTGVATFAAVTGTAALLLAAWHWKHRSDGPAGSGRHQRGPLPGRHPGHRRGAA